jgi:hypothetical protein
VKVELYRFEKEREKQRTAEVERLLYADKVRVAQVERLPKAYIDLER